MSQGIVAVAYIGATILFILALGGLSTQETSRRGNLYGISGMALALLFMIADASFGRESKVAEALENKKAFDYLNDFVDVLDFQTGPKLLHNDLKCLFYYRTNSYGFLSFSLKTPKAQTEQ